jgi:mono/diheme cytochrome c family protein
LIDKLLKMPAPPDDDRYAYSHGTSAGVPNDLAFLVDLRRRVRLEGNGPRGVAVVGGNVYTTEYFTDTLGVVELESEFRRAAGSIPLGPSPKMSVQRQGERLFHDATLCFQHWQSCASCHPDARVDALNWDLLNDGLGTPKNVKSMLLAHKTPPAMSEAVRGSAEEAVRSGIKHIQFAVRPEEEAVAIDEYLKSLQPTPSPLLVDGKLSQSAQRGKAIFERIGCTECHPAPLYTDLKQHDVNSKGKYDRERKFDTPTLVECWRTAPYMHDGQYTTMKELFTKGKHGKVGEGAKKLSDQELNELIDYVLSL